MYVYMPANRAVVRMHDVLVDLCSIFSIFFNFSNFSIFSIFPTCRPAVVWMYDVLVNLCSHRANCPAARYVKVFHLEGVERIPER